MKNMLVNRRSVLASLAGAASLAAIPRVGLAQESPVIRAVRRTLEVNGKAASVFGLIGPDGKPGLDFQFGQPFRARLENETGLETLIHWHGLTPPTEQDGVPDISQPALKDGGSYDYHFGNTRTGTHFMHSHVGLQEQQMLAAPLIVRETKEPVFDEQEHVVIVHDFTFRDPAEILAELQKGGGLHAHHGTSGGTMDHSKMPMPMPGMEMLNDVAFDAFLANDRTLADPEVVQVEKGGRVRLRIINAAAASNMWVDLGGLTGELVAVDGSAVRAVAGNRFPMAIAQRADIRILLPAEGGAFPILFQPEGLTARTGIVLATSGANIVRVAGDAEKAAVALDLTFEKSLRAVGQLPPEPVTRTEMLMLTGGEQGYQWGLNGKPSMHDTLFTVRQGDRVDLMMHNMTGMAHPMHLHGHYFQVVAVNGESIKGAIRDTVLVPPSETVTIRFDANNPGTWALHCHHIYHMNAGMMGVMAYSSAA